MAIVFSNNARTTLASNISNSATTITVADGSVFPSLTGGDIFYCTIDDGTNNEIVEVTAISSNTLTVVRGQDNTTARAFVTGDLIELRLVAKVLETFPQVDAGEVTADEFIGDLRGAVIFKAQAGEAVSKGNAVYVSGISGNTPVIALADADFTSKMPAFGLVLTAASTNGSTEVVTFGTISGVDTSAFSVGDTLYVSTTAGELTNSKPTGEASLLQNIGKVQRSHASSGAIKVGGAGRTNDTPNLNDGNIFIGNASNQATTATLDTSIVPENTNLYYTDSRVQAVSINNVVEDTTPQLGGNLDLNSSDITGTGDINITGTVTADGLTVDGNGSLLTLDNGSNSATISNTNGNITTDFDTINAGRNYTIQANSINAFRIANGGDISFYEDTGTTAKLFWDASAESLGIGTTSPSQLLEISGADAPTIRLNDTTYNQYAEITSNNAGSLLLKADVGNGGTGSTYIGFEVDGSNEVMRIDSTGIEVTGTIDSGDINIGTADTTNGILTIHGGGTGNSEGGEIRLGLAADYDGTYDFYRIDTLNDDLRIGRQGQTDFYIFQDGLVKVENNFEVGGTISSGAITSNIASNGILHDLQIGGASKGKIRVVDGDVVIHSTESSHTGIRLGNGYLAITDNTGAISNGLYDLGLNSYKFRDGYFSGTVNTGPISSGNITTTGYLRGPSTFTIDPATHGDDTGTVVIAGNLQVDGTTTTVNSTTVNVSDKAITLGYDATTDAANNLAGIVVYRPETSNAQFLWSETNERFEINRKLNISQAFSIDASGTNDTRLDIGSGTASNHYAYIDLIGDATYTDYGLRIIRNNGGANTSSFIYHRGTGNFNIETQEAAAIKLRTGGLTALALDSSQNANFTGDVTANGYLQHYSFLYSRNNLRVLNAAGTGWNDWATRSNGTFDLDVGTISSGAISSTGNLDVDGIIDNTRNNTNIGAPSTSDHTAGTRIKFYDANATAFYALGIESNHMWFNSDQGYKWYEDAVERMTLSSGGNLSVDGTITASGDLAIDTDTLFVDVSTDRVGINNSSPSYPLDFPTNQSGLAIRVGDDNVDSYIAFSNPRGFVGFDATGYMTLQGGNSKGIRLNVNNSTFGDGAALTIDNSANATFAGTIDSGNITATGADFSSTIEVDASSSYAIVDNGSIGWSYSPQESGAASVRYFLLFNYDNNASYPYLTNRTPSGRVSIYAGTAAGAGENEKIRVNGGDGTTEIDMFGTLDMNTNNITGVGNITLSGTVDGVDIASRDSVLTSTTTTANAALPKAGGTMTGDINMNGNDITGIKYLQFTNEEITDFTGAYQMLVDANDTDSNVPNHGNTSGSGPFGIYFTGDGGDSTTTLGSGLVKVWHTGHFTKDHIDYFVGLYDTGVTTTEFDYLDGVTSNIQTQLDGKQASGSYLTGNQTITLSGDVSGSGTTSINVTIADDSHNHVISNVDGLQTALDAKLPLAGGTVTGTIEHSYDGVVWQHGEGYWRPVSRKTYSDAGNIGTTGNNFTDVYGEADLSAIDSDVTFTYTAAWEAVETHGGRLPTLAEIRDGVGMGSGQGYDSEYLWTSTPAGPHHVWVAPGAYTDSKSPKIVDITDTSEVYRTRAFFDVSRDNRVSTYSSDGHLRDGDDRVFHDSYHPNADTLTTARTIGGVSFNGSANINLPGVNTAGNQNTSGTAAGLSGTPNITVAQINTTTSADATPAIIATNTGGIGSIIQRWVGDAASLEVKNFSGSDYKISNSQQDNAIAFYNISGGVEILYNGSAVQEWDSTGGTNLISGGFKVGGTEVISSSRTISSGSITATDAYGGGSGDYTNITTPQLKIVATGGTYWRIPHLSGSSTISGVYNYESGKDVYWGEPADTGDYIFRGRTIDAQAGLAVSVSGSDRLSVTGGDVDVVGATDLRITGASRRLNFTSGTGTIRTSTSNQLILQTNSTTALTLETNQNATFAGNITIDSKVTNNNGTILDTDGSSNYIKGGSGGSGILYTEASTFYCNNPMHLNVGRGVCYFENNSYSNANGAGITLRTSSNPTTGSIFDVRSSGQACRFFVGQSITSAGDNPFYVGEVSTGGESTASNYEILLATNGDITAEGNITAYGTVSDIRQKENIEQIDKPIERLEKIKGITFNYKKKSADERLMGVIAQELLEDDILKLAVYEQEDFKAEDDDPLKHTYGVRYEHLTAILIEAVKEQQKQIESLKSEINNLKGEK